MTLEKVTNLINGKFKPALDGDEIDIIDPSTDLLIGHLPGIQLNIYLRMNFENFSFSFFA